MPTRAEIRSRLLGPSRVETLTFDGLVFEVVVPLLNDVVRALASPSDRHRDSFLTWRCLRKDGIPIFDTLEEVLSLDAERARLVDACAKKVREMIEVPTPAAKPEG